MPAATDEAKCEMTSHEPCDKIQNNRNGLIYVLRAS